jgi:hypothetical protein
LIEDSCFSLGIDLRVFLVDFGFENSFLKEVIFSERILLKKILHELRFVQISRIHINPFHTSIFNIKDQDLKTRVMDSFFIVWDISYELPHTIELRTCPD